MVLSTRSTQELQRAGTPSAWSPAHRNPFADFAAQRKATKRLKSWVAGGTIAAVEFSTYVELLEWASDIQGRHNVYVVIDPRIGKGTAIVRATGQILQRASAPAFSPQYPKGA